MVDLTELGEILHEQHFRILVQICGLENRISGQAGDRPLDLHHEGDRLLLDELAASLNGVIDHNAFEEQVLFPLLCRRGESELVGLLAQEHTSIGPLARQLRCLAETILAEGCTAPLWADFRSVSRELISEMMLHLQKEEASVVQRLGVLLDAETDHRLAHCASGDAAAQHAVNALPEPRRSMPAPRRIPTASSAARIAARRRSTTPRHA